MSRRGTVVIVAVVGAIACARPPGESGAADSGVGGDAAIEDGASAGDGAADADLAPLPPDTDLAFVPSGHPNEPAGFSPFTHRPFLVKAPLTADPTIEDGWSDRGDANSTVVDAATIATLGAGGTSLGTASDPASPTMVLQSRVPIGQVGGSGPIQTLKYVPSSSYKELYLDFWWQVSSNWHNGYVGGAGNSKILFVEIGRGNQLIPIVSGFGTGTLTLKMAGQNLIPGGDVDASGSFPGNIGLQAVSRGQWYRIEMYFKKNSADGVADGELTIWVDGVQRTHKTAIQYAGTHASLGKPFATSFFDQIKINPTWSSGSTPLLAADGPVYGWYADVYASGKP